jgi:hypothetical protein
MHTEFLSKNLNGRYHVRDVGLDGRLILKMDFKEMESQRGHWIQLARGTVQRRILVNTTFDL